jgi:hypothetical protein
MDDFVLVNSSSSFGLAIARHILLYKSEIFLSWKRNGERFKKEISVKTTRTFDFEKWKHLRSSENLFKI